MGNIVKHLPSREQNDEDPNVDWKQKQASLKACCPKTTFQIPKAAKVDSIKAKAVKSEIHLCKN